MTEKYKVLSSWQAGEPELPGAVGHPHWPMSQQDAASTLFHKGSLAKHADGQGIRQYPTLTEPASGKERKRR